MRGVLDGQGVITLVDTGATHNFIDARLVEKRGIQIEEFGRIRVRVADGYVFNCDRKITGLPLEVNNYAFKVDLYVVHMGDTNIVLGMSWLHDIDEFTLNLKEMEMRFKVNGKTQILKAIEDSDFKMVSFWRMSRLIRHDWVEWAVEFMLMPSQEGQQKTKYPPNIQKLRVKGVQ